MVATWWLRRRQRWNIRSESWNGPPTHFLIKVNSQSRRPKRVQPKFTRSTYIIIFSKPASVWIKLKLRLVNFVVVSSRANSSYSILTRLIWYQTIYQDSDISQKTLELTFCAEEKMEMILMGSRLSSTWINWTSQCQPYSNAKNTAQQTCCCLQ